MIQISQDSSLPLYQRIVTAICEAIVAGQLLPGAKLPARQVLAKDLGVNMVTVRSAYERLEQQGIVVSRHGAGTFVQNDAADRLQKNSGRKYDAITVVIGAEHLGDCRRETIHIVSDILSGVSEQLGARVGRYSYATDVNRRLLDHITDQGAVIIYQLGGHSDESAVRELQKRGIPVLIAWGHDVPFPLPRIHYDTVASAAMGPQHLVDCGYRRIGYMGSKEAGDVSLHIKFLQFTNVLQEAGLDLLARDVRQVLNVPGEACLAMADMLASGDLPEALFIDSDLKAMEAIRALHQAGLRVPDDIGIVSHDGFAEASLFQPPLTVVRTPRRAIGRRVGNLLLNWPPQGMPPFWDKLPAELVVRGSTRMAEPHVSAQDASNFNSKLGDPTSSR
jgi:DNA-binding LacI/PurR family transcriptional regulator